MRTKCAVVDNYDSFTYNRVHMIKERGGDGTVLRNDRFDLMDLMAFDRIVLSPGPGIPSEAGLLLDVIRRYAGIRPILGVCLGHRRGIRCQTAESVRCVPRCFCKGDTGCRHTIVRRSATTVSCGKIPQLGCRTGKHARLS